MAWTAGDIYFRNYTREQSPICRVILLTGATSLSPDQFGSKFDNNNNNNYDNVYGAIIITKVIARVHLMNAD